MKKLIKLLLPLLFLIGYTISAHFIYWGVNEDVFSIKDSLQIVIGNLILIAGLLLYARYVCFNQWKELLKTKLKFREGFIILLMIPGIQFLMTRIISILMKCFHYTCTPTIMDLGETHLFVFDALFALLIAPLIEELLFRFCIISSYNSRTGKVYGMVVGAVLFGWMHSTVPVRAEAIVLGLILGIIFLATNSILICIIIHSGFNFVITISACISSYIQNEEIISFASSLIYVNTPILLAAVFISLLGAALLLKNISYTEFNTKKQ